MKYIQEIDGLRAFSILIVIIFHFFPDKLKSGYLGVDIFFIISGYLITSKLLELENKNKKKLLKKFFIRRIKRLFPALFFFFFFTTSILSIFLLYSDFNKYFSSLIAAKTFWANWYFWTDGGYFGGNDKIKPLLHTWSIAVEVQFYVIYSIIILIFILINKKWKISLIILIFLLTIISFLLWAYIHNVGGQNPAYFLLPTRIWQFSLGGIIVLMQKKNLGSSLSRNKKFSLISVLIILFSISVELNNQLKTILVSAGVALFIFIKNKQKFIICLFKNPLTIFIGKISYSLYLYHWLIAVLILYYFIDHPPLIISIIGIFFSVLLSVLSFRYIEIPFRNNLSIKHTIGLVIICTLFSFSIMKILKKNEQIDIANSWASVVGTNFRCAPTSFVKFGASRACLLTKKEEFKTIVVVLGNSHAQMYAPLIAKKLKENNLIGILIPLSGCLPTVTVNISTSCLLAAKKNLDEILKSKNFKHVIIGMTWYEDKYVDLHGNIANQDLLLNSLINLADLLIKNEKTVSVFSPIPIPKINLASNLSRMIKFKKVPKSYIEDKIEISSNVYFSKFEVVNTKLKEKFTENYIEVFRDLCDYKKCYYVKNNIMYFADDNHLSQNILDLLTKTNQQLNYIFKKIK